MSSGQSFISALSILFFFCMYGCKDGPKKMTDNSGTPRSEKAAVEKRPFESEGSLVFYAPSGAAISGKIPIEFAETEAERTAGLMHRRSMPGEWGMMFIFEEEAYQAFWMKNTHIPIDILFINKDSVIVQIDQNARPQSEASIRSYTPVRYVLEVPAGLSTAYGLRSGYRVAFERD